MKRKYIFLFILCCLSFQQIRAAGHYTVIISLDGFRWDYPQWYNTPFLDFMAQKGVASGLVPSYPSKTFPNHYALATGLYPDHHGLVANSFYDRSTGKTFSLSDRNTKMDPRFYGGEPIWITARRQGLKTAVFYWPGSDVKIKGEYPDTYYNYDRKPRLTFAQRMNGIVSELALPEKDRPQLIMAYLSEPDGNGHNYGPQSRQVRRAVVRCDSLLKDLYNKISKLTVAKDVNIIVVSDHGMEFVPSSHNINLARYLKTSWVRMADGNAPANIYARKGCVDSIYDALRNIPHIRVWRRSEIPAVLHYGANPRIGDVVVDPQLGYSIGRKDSIPDGGTHGYDPSYMEMHAVFRAMGPDFVHTSHPHFRNVDVYPLLCHLLKIRPAENDGSFDEIRDMVK